MRKTEIRNVTQDITYIKPTVLFVLCALYITCVTVYFKAVLLEYYLWQIFSLIFFYTATTCSMGAV